MTRKGKRLLVCAMCGKPNTHTVSVAIASPAPKGTTGTPTTSQSRSRKLCKDCAWETYDDLVEAFGQKGLL